MTWSELHFDLRLTLKSLFLLVRRKGTLDVEVQASGFTKDLEISFDEVRTI